MSRRRVVFALPTAVLWAPGVGWLAACGGGDTDEELVLQHVPVEGLGPVDAGTLVFRDEAQWAAFWAQHPRALSPPSAPPDVDFTRQAVAAVFAGPRPRCRRLEIYAGTAGAEGVELRYRIVTFGQSTPSSCIGSDPFVANLADMVLVPADAGAVRIVETA